MRTALCLSGHIRTLNQNIDSIKKNILPHNGEVDIFIHTWDTYGWRTEGFDITKDGFKGFDYYSDKIDLDQIKKELSPKKFVVDNYTDLEDMILEKSKSLRNRKKYDIDRPENLVSMSYKIFQCNELKKSIEKDENFKYDIVVRTRPDFNYHSPIIFSNFDKDVLHTFSKYTYDGICDMFAFSSSENMDIYSDAFNRIYEMCDKETIPIGNGIYKVPDDETSSCNGHEFYQKYLQRYLKNKFDIVDLPMDLLRDERDKQRYNI